MDNYKFTDGVHQAIKNSKIFSQKCKLNYVGTEQFLYSLLTLPKCEACKCLEKYQVNLNNYPHFLRYTFDYNSTIGDFTPRAKKVIKIAEDIAESSKVDFVSTEHFLLAILSIKDCKAMAILKKMEVDYEGIKAELSEKVYNLSRGFSNTSNESEDNETVEEEVKENPLTKFGYDLTEKARKGKLDPVIGRSKEIDRVINKY